MVGDGSEKYLESEIMNAWRLTGCVKCRKERNLSLPPASYPEYLEKWWLH